MFDHCIYFNTTALARRLEQRWAGAFKSFGLTPPQAFLLRAVLSEPGVPQRELARTMAVSRPTATRALDALAQKRFIERVPSTQDGREMLVYPTQRSLAIEKALNEASVPGFEVVYYSEHALSSGAQASAIAYIQIKLDETTTRWGAGVDTNIELASIRAVLSALNRSMDVEKSAASTLSLRKNS